MKYTAAKSNPWQDHYARRARKERFPARSVYKLQEIQRKYHLIHKGDRVLDLGAFPGSWLLYAAERVGNGGRVLGIDLKPVTVPLPSRVEVRTADVLAGDINLPTRSFNVVLSDMAPRTTGNKIVDTARSLELCRTALDIAQRVLKPGGCFVCKIFQSGDSRRFADRVRAIFERQEIFKPRSSRKASKEIFIVGLGKK